MPASEAFVGLRGVLKVLPWGPVGGGVVSGRHGLRGRVQITPPNLSAPGFRVTGGNRVSFSFSD